MNARADIPRKPASAAGFSLIEVTIALGVAAFCLLTIFGLLPLGLNSNQQSLEQTTAGNISTAILADLRNAEPIGANSTPRYDIPIPAAPVSAAGTTQTSGTTLYLSADGIPSPTGQVVTGGTGSNLVINVTVNSSSVSCGFYRILIQQ